MLKTEETNSSRGFYWGGGGKNVRRDLEVSIL
jgi:hypothetical protein